MSDSTQQCDFEPKKLEKEQFSVPSLLGFLKTRIPLFENTFREQKVIENSVGKQFHPILSISDLSRILEEWKYD